MSTWFPPEENGMSAFDVITGIGSHDHLESQPSTCSTDRELMALRTTITALDVCYASWPAAAGSGDRSIVAWVGRVKSCGCMCIFFPVYILICEESYFFSDPPWMEWIYSHHIICFEHSWCFHGLLNMWTSVCRWPTPFHIMYLHI